MNLDPDVLQVARALASAEHRPLGQVISELARRGMTARAEPFASEDGFPVFPVSPDAPLITDEMVRLALEES